MDKGNYYCCENECGYRTLAVTSEEAEKQLAEDGGYDRNKESMCPRCKKNALIFIDLSPLSITVTSDRLLLFHGTSSKHLNSIRKEGLRSPYLTDSVELAKYYAEVEVDYVGGEPVIFQIAVSIDQLRCDKQSMDEPVSYGVYSISDLEEAVVIKIRKLAIEHPDWVLEGIVRLPNEAYDISLTTVGTCWHKATIKPEELHVLM